MSVHHISCIIPTHGRPEFLHEALGSVLDQVTPPSEIIVVSDDGDEDSRRVAESFGRSEIPVRYVRNESQPGASGSRNLGAVVATGDWLAFLDDDDLWRPDMLRHSSEIIDSTGAPCVITWLEMFRDDLRAPGLMIRPGVVARDAASRSPGVTGSNFVISRAAFERVGGFDPEMRVMNDLDFFYRYLLSDGEYAVNGRFEVLQRRHSAGQLTRASESRARGIDRYIMKHRPTMRISDVRQLRLAAHRIRYHAAGTTAAKLKHLALGALNGSPKNVLESVANWRSRSLWRETPPASEDAKPADAPGR